MSKPNIVVIGGGTGSFTLLSGLKNHQVNITALVNMADDGGSTGVLRDELGVLPPGDVRQCLVALGESSRLRDLFNFRFGEGSLKGHSFGNLFISAVEKMTSDFGQAVELAGELLQITGRVLPITTEKTHLMMKDEQGEAVTRQFDIGNRDFGSQRRPDIWLAPSAKIYPHAAAAINEADMVVIAPGNLYGSLAPALLVDGVREALTSTKARVVYVCNLVTKPGQTDGFSVADYAEEIERFVGAPVLDFVVFKTEKPSAKLMKRYAHDGEFLVEYDDESLNNASYRAIGCELIDDQPVSSAANDAIASSRSLIRHDTEKTAQILVDTITDNS